MELKNWLEVQLYTHWFWIKLYPAGQLQDGGLDNGLNDEQVKHVYPSEHVEHWIGQFMQVEPERYCPAGQVAGTHVAIELETLKAYPTAHYVQEI